MKHWNTSSTFWGKDFFGHALGATNHFVDKLEGGGQMLFSLPVYHDKLITAKLFFIYLRGGDIFSYNCRKGGGAKK